MRSQLPKMRVVVAVDSETSLLDLIELWWRCRFDRLLCWVETKADALSEWGKSK